MAKFNAIDVMSGWIPGIRSIRANKAIADNFALLEPSLKDSGAADYIPVLADSLIGRSRATAQTVTLPTNVAVAFPIGTTLRIIQTGAGALTLVAPAGGAINKLATKTLVFAAQWGEVRVTKIAANTWVASGDLTVA